MRKYLYAILGLDGMCLCLASTTAYSQDSRNIWKLPNDVLGTGNQISFNQAANGVWYFMESSSLAHYPLTYRFLPDFTVPCFAGNQLLTGLECWGDVSNPDVNFGNPRVNLNASSSENNFHPPRTLSQIPGPTSLSIVAWRSPVDGFVNVTGTYTIRAAWR